MRNNLAELTGASIYRVHQRWRPILRGCAGGRWEGRFTSTGYRGIHWRFDSEARHATYCDQRWRGNKTIAWQARVNGDHQREGRTGVAHAVVSHPVLEGKPNANHVRARIRTHIHSDYIIGHHHTMLELNSGKVLNYIKMSKTSIESNT
jgi:hypothetical protein